MTKLGLNIQQLYKQDFVLWVDETVKQLQNQDVENLDWHHLIEEIKGLGSEQRHKVDSYLLQLLIHLLLYQYWEEQKQWCQKGWKDEIDNFRVQLEILFASKTLYNYFDERIQEIYPKARRRAIIKTELPKDIFPEYCPFTTEELLNCEFFPE